MGETPFMGSGGSGGSTGTRGRRGGVPGGVLALVGVVAGVLYSGYVLDAVVSDDHDWVAVVSTLQVPGHPLSAVLRVADICCAALVLVLLPFLGRRLPPNRSRRVAVVATGVFALGCAAAALVPLPCTSYDLCTSGPDRVQWWVHDLVSVVSQAGAFVGAAAVGLGTRGRGPAWLRRCAWATVWLGGVLGTITLGVSGMLDGPAWEIGMAQRFQVTTTSLWLVCLGVAAAALPRGPDVVDPPVAADRDGSL